MTCADIKALLKDSIGLHADAVGDSSIDRAIRQRMNALGISDDNAYLSLLKSDSEELPELIEEVVVSETWFFRNMVPFQALAKFLPGLLDQSSNRSLRILSLPCSTGEEPYSIAITLLECGELGHFDFVVNSMDVSKRAITKAKRAVYGSYSFREGDEIEAIKEKYFLKEKNGFHLKPDVKKYVTPVQGNVLTDNIAPSDGYYDIIFCRNLLIYFDRETQARVLKKLESVLKPTGILFLGHAETSQAVNDLFTRLNYPKAFAYQKNNAKPITTNRERANGNIKALEAAYQQLMKATPAVTPKKVKRPSVKSSGNTKWMDNTGAREELGFRDEITRHIELGRLSEAASECERALEKNPESSEAYYLLGLISHLEGSGGAAESFLKKAMYLDPNHHGALGLSAMLAEKRGDAEVAQTLRRREQRVLKRTSSHKNDT